MANREVSPWLYTAPIKPCQSRTHVPARPFLLQEARAAPSIPRITKQGRSPPLPDDDTESISHKQGTNHTKGKHLAALVFLMAARQDTAIAALLNSLLARNSALTTKSSSSFRETGLKDWESWVSVTGMALSLEMPHTEILRNRVKGRINIPGVLLQTPAIKSSSTRRGKLCCCSKLVVTPRASQPAHWAVKTPSEGWGWRGRRVSAALCCTASKQTCLNFRFSVQTKLRNLGSWGWRRASPEWA